MSARCEKQNSGVLQVIMLAIACTLIVTYFQETIVADVAIEENDRYGHDNDSEESKMCR